MQSSRNIGLCPVRLADMLSAVPLSSAEYNSAELTDCKSMFRSKNDA